MLRLEHTFANVVMDGNLCSADRCPLLTLHFMSSCINGEPNQKDVLSYSQIQKHACFCSPEFCMHKLEEEFVSQKLWLP